MKVEGMHNETLHSATQAEHVIKSIKKTETIDAIDPELGERYQRSKEEAHSNQDKENEAELPEGEAQTHRPAKSGGHGTVINVVA